MAIDQDRLDKILKESGESLSTTNLTNTEKDKLTQINNQQLISSNKPDYSLSASQPQCPQCGLFHPPLPQGEKCPNAPIKNQEGKDVDINKYLTILKDVIISQSQKKNIQDIDDLFKKIIILVTKFLESIKVK